MSSSDRSGSSDRAAGSKSTGRCESSPTERGACSHFPPDALPMPQQARAQIGRRRAARAVAHRHRDIDGREGMLVQAKGLAREALQEVARDRAAAGTRRYREPEAWMIFVVGEYRQCKVRVGESLAALPYLAKFGRLVQSLARLELELGQGPLRRQGQRRLRPFARRRASTARPLLVAIRARNPWVRTRCRLLGLKVRFIRQLKQKQRTGRFAKGRKGTDRALMCQ